MRKTLLSLFFSCFVFILNAQQTLPAFNYVPQGPITAAFTRYGEIPVDLSTGVTNISIPIYNFSENGINIPISISYHASGNKVNDIAGTVGLGWTLNAGGGLTRTILGKKDEDVDRGAYMRSPWVTWQEFLDTADARETRNQRGWFYELHNYYLKNPVDYYSDRFYYSLGNGESGVFRKDFATGEYKTLPYKAMKIRFIQATANNNLKVEMTTVDGTRYIFNYNYTWSSDYWNAEKIINSAGTDSVMIYSHDEYVSSYGFTSFQEFGSFGHTQMPWTIPVIKPSGFGPCSNEMYITQKHDPDPTNYTTSTHSEKVPIIDSIVGANTTVRFTYAHDREEVSYLFGDGNRLTNIKVYSKQSNEVVKNVNFSHGYLGAGTEKRLLLTGIQTGTNGEEKHAFKYNQETLPSYQNGLTALWFQQDLWGYKNAAYKSSLLFADFAPGGNNSMFPDEEKAQAGILQEIKYPTGGKTVFEYESNRVPRGFYGTTFSTSNVPADGKVGGLRIKKISSYAYEGAEPQIKSYEYVCDLDVGHGKLDYDNFAYTQEDFYYYRPWVDGCGLTFNWYTGTTSKNICVSTPMGEYIGGPQAPVYYSVVTEYNGDAGKHSGKTVYTYRRADMYRRDDEPYIPIVPQFRSSWHYDAGSFVPPLLKKEEYKNNNGQFVLVRKTETSYTSIRYDKFITGLNLASTITINDMSPTIFDDNRAFDTYLDLSSSPYYFSTIRYSNDFAYPGLELPEKVDVYDYVDGNNYVKTSTGYTYNNYGRQTGLTISTSKGEIVNTQMTYPDNYPNQAPYNTMVERNILTPVVKQSVYKNTIDPQNLLQSMNTNYNYWNVSTQTWGGAVSNQILPQSVETKKSTNDVETRVRYFSYDQKGNPIYVAKENDMRQLYLWDYNKTYPVAQVVNVSDDDKKYVVYHSFEAVTSWPTGNGIIVDDNTAPTGEKCLSLFGVNNLQYPLNSNKSYILSYWYKAGSSISVAGNTTILANPPAKNGWVFTKRLISGTSTIVISGSGYIDEIRLYPEAAQMTTFAYKPLVGMTDQCDANDRMTYYEYDASGRLSLIKDDNGNISKKICYNFQGQPDACGENAIPKWQLTGTTRCKPCAQNPVYWTNITQLEERDNNVNSETYGNTRFRDTGEIGGPGRCYILGDWQLTGNLRCRTVGGQLTGEQERERKDMNPCSSTFGNTVWEVFTTNTTACPVPAIFQSLDVSGDYYRQNCGQQQIPKPYPVSMPLGSFTSSIDIQDATNKAKAEAQRLANLNGQCITLYVRMVKTLVSDPADYQQYTDNTFYFYSDAAGTIPLTLPITIPVNFQLRSYWTENGSFAYEEAISNTSAYGNSGSNNAVYQVESTFCPNETYCRHEEITLQPGRYVIIP